MPLIFILCIALVRCTLCYRFQTNNVQKIHFKHCPIAMSTADSSDRLRKARLRLAEAQGVIPIGRGDGQFEETSLNLLIEIGASENNNFDFQDLKSAPSLSKVREISWRVAEPAVKYDPVSASQKFFSKPIAWIVRNIQFILPFTSFGLSLIIDILTNNEERNRKLRAKELLDLVSVQSPALIKAGQALASRSDLLPKDYLDSLQKLQDRCPPYPTEQAIKLFESELGVNIDQLIELESNNPIAAASIGQVYKGKLRSNGAKIALKIQRPGCEEAIAIDLFIMRWYCQLAQKILAAFNRNVDLVSIIDDFGEIIYREIDYRAEAVNAQRFAELYSTIPDVFVPKIYTDLSTSKILTMEWVDGARLNDKATLNAMGLDGSKFIDTLVQCSLRQMLENGFFHADPHAGNLLAMSTGKLCYLDFGMVSYVEASQRLSIIEAVVHLVNRDFVSLTELYRRMGFIPMDVDTAPIIVALEDALPDVLNAPVGELNFKNVINKLGDIMYKFPFSLPPFYIAIIRCLGVLEGLAIQVDSEFRIINDAYPYIASRLLTDPSEELQAALRRLLFNETKLRWDRLEELIERASSTSDYDVGQALDILVSYIFSDNAKNLRISIQSVLVELLDEVGEEAYGYAKSISFNNNNGVFFIQIIFEIIANAGRRGGFKYLSNLAANAAATLAENATRRPNSYISSAAKFVTPYLRAVSEGDKIQDKTNLPNSIDTESFLKVSRRILREPTFREMMTNVANELGDRAASRLVRSWFGQQYRPKDSRDTTTVLPTIR